MPTSGRSSTRRTRRADLRNAEDELITLGFLPKGASLRSLTLDLEGGQVAGYYSPEKKQLFVVEPIRRPRRRGARHLRPRVHPSAPGPASRAHGPRARTPTTRPTRTSARLALVEGDAVSVQTTWMTDNLTPKQLGEVMSAALDPAAMKALSDAPRYLRETASVPVQRRARVRDGPAGHGRLRLPWTPRSGIRPTPPSRSSTRTSTAPARRRSRCSLPAKLASKLGAGWSVAAEDTLGEEILRIWLEQVLSTPDAARCGRRLGRRSARAAARARMAPSRSGLRTEWDTPADADEFLAAARADQRPGLSLDASLEHAAGSTVVTLAIGDGSAVLLAALGN